MAVKRKVRRGKERYVYKREVTRLGEKLTALLVDLTTPHPGRFECSLTHGRDNYVMALRQGFQTASVTVKSESRLCCLWKGSALSEGVHAWPWFTAVLL